MVSYVAAVWLQICAVVKYFHDLSKLWFIIILWFWNCRSSPVLKSAVRKVSDKNFCEFCVINKNHENIRTQKFWAIQYIASYSLTSRKQCYTFVTIRTPFLSTLLVPQGWNMNCSDVITTAIIIDHNLCILYLLLIVKGYNASNINNPLLTVYQLSLQILLNQARQPAASTCLVS